MGPPYNAPVRVLAFTILAGSLSAIIITAAPPRQNSAPIERAFGSFWSASDRGGAAGGIDAIIRTGVSFEHALTLVRHGRTYAADVPRGPQVGRTRTFDGVDHALRVRRSRVLRSRARLSGPRPPSRRHRAAPAGGCGPHTNGRLAPRRGRDRGVPVGVGGFALVVGDRGRAEDRPRGVI